MGRFYPVRCRRSVAEQRYIRARMDLWHKMPEKERETVRSLIWNIAEGGIERAALEAVAIRGVSPRTAAERYHLDKGRVYHMLRVFLEGYEIWG